ncbi:MAG: hypothetical protein AAFX99_04530 [Myxococcota bacterium]
MELKLNVPINFLLLVIGLLMGMILAVAVTSMADGPELDEGPRAIPYNGILEYNGQAVNGQADLRFTLTDVPGADVQGANCYYVEEHDNVTAYSGRFSVNIGSVDTINNAIDPCVFDSDAIYIEIGVRDAAANEDNDDSNDSYVMLAGTQRIHPVPFSYWAAEGSNFTIDGNLTVAGNIQNPSGDVTINDSLDITGNIQNPSGEVDINDDTKINRMRLTFHSSDTPMLLFDNNSFDSNGDLGTMGDYKLVLRAESTPAASYGFGIQSGTLFANANGNIDLKINGNDVLNVHTGGMNLSGQANVSGNASIGGNMTTGGNMTIGGNMNIQSGGTRLLGLPGHTDPPVSCEASNIGSMYYDSGGTGSGSRGTVCVCMRTGGTFDAPTVDWINISNQGRCAPP